MKMKIFCCCCYEFVLKNTKYCVLFQNTLKQIGHLEFWIFLLNILKIVTFLRRKVPCMKRALKSDVMTLSSTGSTIKKM